MWAVPDQPLSLDEGARGGQERQEGGSFWKRQDVPGQAHYWEEARMRQKWVGSGKPRILTPGNCISWLLLSLKAPLAPLEKSP